MNLAKRERTTLCRLLSDIGPDKPTLCQGWLTRDLAAHLWVREHDVISLPGIGIQRLQNLTISRMEKAKQRHSYTEMIKQLQHPNIVIKQLDLINTLELFIHHEDVLRANTFPNRKIIKSDQDILWKYVRGISYRCSLRTKVSLVIKRSDQPKEMIRTSSGSRIVTLIGLPSELILWLTGRQKVAQVELFGENLELKKIQTLNLNL